jgi:hypothetical protein
MLVILPSQDLKEVVFHHPLTPRYHIRGMRYFSVHILEAQAPFPKLEAASRSQMRATDSDGTKALPQYLENMTDQKVTISPHELVNANWSAR